MRIISTPVILLLIGFLFHAECKSKDGDIFIQNRIYNNEWNYAGVLGVEKWGVKVGIGLEHKLTENNTSNKKNSFNFSLSHPFSVNEDLFINLGAGYGQSSFFLDYGFDYGLTYNIALSSGYRFFFDNDRKDNTRNQYYLGVNYRFGEPPVELNKNADFDEIRKAYLALASRQDVLPGQIRKAIDALEYDIHIRTQLKGMIRDGIIIKKPTSTELNYVFNRIQDLRYSLEKRESEVAIEHTFEGKALAKIENELERDINYDEEILIFFKMSNNGKW